MEEEFKLVDYFKTCDYISSPLQLKVNGSERFQTHFAGFLSICIVIMVAALSISLIIEILQKTVPTTTLSSAFNDTVLINLTQNFPLMASFIFRGGKMLENADSYFTLDSINFNYTFKMIDGVKTLTSQKVPIPFPHCENSTWDKMFGNNSQMLQKELISSELFRTYCRPNIHNESFVFNQYGAYPLAFLNIALNFCDNKTSLVTCQPMDVILNTMKNFFIIFTYPDYYFDHVLQEPGIFFVNTEALPVSSIVYKRYYYNLKNIVYNTDVGLVFEDIRPKVYFQKSGTSKDINTELTGIYPNTFAEITFTANSKVYDIFNRKYKKIPQLLAEVGGVINALVIMATIINIYIERKLREIGILEMCVNESFIQRARKKDEVDLRNVSENNPNASKSMRSFEIINLEPMSNTNLKFNNFVQDKLEKKQTENLKLGENNKQESVARSIKGGNNQSKLKSIVFDNDLILDLISRTEIDFQAVICPCRRSDNEKEKFELAEKFYNQVFDVHFLFGNVLDTQIKEYSKDKKKKLMN